MRALLVGRTTIIVEDAKAHLQMPDVELFSATDIDQCHEVLARTRIDHVIIGGGIDLDQRLAIVRAIFEASDATTVHLKDVASGPQQYLSFVRSVLVGARSATAAAL